MPFQSTIHGHSDSCQVEHGGEDNQRLSSKASLDPFPQSGFVRVKQIVNIPGKRSGFIPVCESTWWQWVKDGKAPKPIKLGLNVTAWRAEEIRKFADEIGLAGEEAKYD